MNTEQISEAVSSAIVSGLQRLNKKQVVPLTPRALNDPEAGRYIGLSGAWMQRSRRIDQERVNQGLPPTGPRPTFRGRNVFYLIEDLDAWLDGLKIVSTRKVGGEV